jgi:hypothetical protein
MDLEQEEKKDKRIPYLFIGLSIIFIIIGWIAANGESKSQYVRLIDVFIYGPYLTYLAFQKEYVFTILEKVFLLLMGMATISFNARNYLKIR